MFKGAVEANAEFISSVLCALEDFYSATLLNAWNHLDPQELTPLKKQVNEIRVKKKY